jgi:hypothetical protein
MDAKDLYREKYKILKKEINKTTENGKIFHAHGLVASIL